MNKDIPIFTPEWFIVKYILLLLVKSKKSQNNEPVCLN